MKTLVLGSTGSIGSLVVEQLLAAGVPVHRATRRPMTDGQMAFDWRVPETWSAALVGCTALYLTTPEQAGNLAGPVERFLDLAERGGIERVVLLSAVGVEGSPDVTGMRQIESAVAGRTFSTSVLRANTFMQNFIAGPFRPVEGKVLVPAGGAAVSFIDVRDIAKCVVQELGEEQLGGVHELTGPESLTFADAVSAITTASGETVTYVDLSEDSARNMMVEGGTPPPVVEMILGFYATLRSCAHSATTPSVRMLTGASPTPFSRFAADHAMAWKP
jgi:uncharacterized protein YbjT (DUF2867 family)